MHSVSSLETLGVGLTEKPSLKEGTFALAMVQFLEPLE